MADPKIAGKGPIAMDMEPGLYAWCGCGLSKNQPFCDNAHKGTEYEGSDVAAMAVEIEEEGEKHWCNCKHTKTPPFCDGTHSTL